MFICRVVCFFIRIYIDIVWVVIICRFSLIVYLTLELRIIRGTDYSVWMKIKVGM